MKNNNNISLHEPKFDEKEIRYISECIESTWVSTSGKYIDKFEDKIAKYIGVKYAVACINATVSLQVSLLVSGVTDGDEVIAPSITFIAPINAIKYNNAEPIFMDSDKYFNIDQEKTIDFIHNETSFKNGYTYNKKTKKIIRALVIVHIFGFPCEVEELVKLCKKRNIRVIEDASESLGSRYQNGYFDNCYTGNVGDISCISFNGNKIITAGSGGMILTNNKRISNKVRYLVRQAKDNSIKYIHNEIGFNYAQTNIQAAIGLAQYKKFREILSKKILLHKKYNNQVSLIKGLNIVKKSKNMKPNFWLNILDIDEDLYKRSRDDLIQIFHKKKINVRPIWLPNHLQKVYKKNQSYHIERALKLYKTSLCLPSSYHLKDEEFKRIEKILHE